MNIAEVYPSRFIRAIDLGDKKRVVLEIDRVEMEKMGQPPEEKPVLYFKKAKRGLVLNKTNAYTIADMYGPETDNWKGKPVVLTVDTIYAFGEQMDVIRVAAQKGGDGNA